jgi:basic membrane lipoprotein Med (substrate-binding protein (PBP1-ABC) superfamily)
VAKDWAALALADLKNTWKFIDGYDLGDYYFTKSMAKLEEVVTGKSPDVVDTRASFVSFEPLVSTDV